MSPLDSPSLQTAEGGPSCASRLCARPPRLLPCGEFRKRPRAAVCRAPDCGGPAAQPVEDGVCPALGSSSLLTRKPQRRREMLTTDRAGRLAGPGSQPQRQCPFTRSAGCGPLTCRNGVESGHGRASSHVPFRDAAGPAALSLEEGSTFMSTWVFFLGGVVSERSRFW